jgi:hypothetical protein
MNNKVSLSLHFLNFKAFDNTTLHLLFETFWAVIVRFCTSKKLAVVSPTRLCTYNRETNPTRNVRGQTGAIMTNSFYIWQITARLWAQCCNRHIASRSWCPQGSTCCCRSREGSLAPWVYQVLILILENNIVVLMKILK